MKNLEQRTVKSWSWKSIGLVTAAVIGVFVAYDGYYTVDLQDAAVVKQWGAFDGVTFEGLHFKVPFAQSVVHVPLTQQKDTYDKLEAYTSDQQTATVVATVQWKADRTKLEELARQYGDLAGVKAKLIDSNLPTFLKNVTGKYTAVSAVQDRAKLNSDITEALQASVGDAPIIIERVNVENIDYDDKYETAIQLRNEAEVAVRTKQQELAKAKVEADIKVAQSVGAANAVRENAFGERDKAIAEGEGKARAIAKVAAALAAAGPLYIENRRIEQWRGDVPTTMLPNATIPFVDLTPKLQ